MAWDTWTMLRHMAMRERRKEGERKLHLTWDKTKKKGRE